MMAEIVLTPPESKKLIAKAIASLKEVKQALKSGYIVIKHGTTNAFVFKEITGEEPKPPYVCGIVTPDATCVDELGSASRINKGHSHYWVVEKGEILDNPNLEEIFGTLKKGDVFVSGANALDLFGNAAILIAAKNAGTFGKVYIQLTSSEVTHIIPASLEKVVFNPIQDIIKKLKLCEIKYAMGLPVRVLPLFGKVITEIEALRTIANVDVIQIAAGGVAGAYGAVVLGVMGDDREVEKILKVVEEVKGTQDYPVKISNCNTCLFKNLTYCFERGRYKW
ncbi:hypothetical protein DRP05_10260 [Archaeoglobales archaeon]|nr:MAG: hypothetical protein DRP05_10260 [Archaeoglobales archaeon]